MSLHTISVISFLLASVHLNRLSMGNDANSISLVRFLPNAAPSKGDTTVVERPCAESSELTDEALLATLGIGDDESLRVLFRRYARLVRNLGHKILRDASEADDLLQDVFLYIYRRNSLFDIAKGSARSWIIQVAYTQALIRRRRLKSIGFYSSDIRDGSFAAEPRTNKGTDYDYTVEGLFGRNLWKKIVEDLTEDQRETFRLHFFEGYTFAEIADKLGQSYSNIRNHHYRGLEKLRKYLAEIAPNRR
jgi:RNA polymerase sigma-70 factor (ECF subfamily)